MVVTTVIPTIGRPSLARAIASVMAQAVPWRLIVVGDGIVPDVPADGRILAVRGPMPDYPADERMRWNMGGVRAFDAGLDLVTSEWCAYLADDDEYMPAHHAALLAASADADVVYGQSRTPGRASIYGDRWPPEDADICMGAWIMRTSLGMRARETPGMAWDLDWWRRLIPIARFAHVREIVHRFNPAPETRRFHDVNS